MASTPQPRPWPADSIERRPVAALVPYARNARKHSAAQVDQIAASIREWGWTNPVLVDEDGTIIAGHGRVLAAQKLGIPDVPVMVARGWTEAQRRAYLLADNQLALNAEWDTELLKVEIGELRASDFDVSLIGFGDEVLAALFAETNAGLTDPDDAPEPPADPVSALGDVWVLGRHRLVCGDSATVDAVDSAMAGAKASLCLTDPPYGLGDTRSAKNNYDSYVDSHENLVRLIADFFPLAQNVADIVVLTPGNRNQYIYPQPTWMMAWFVPAGTGLGPWGFCCWQPILCFGKDPKMAKGKGCYPDAVVHTEASEKNGHPCPKPIKFWRWLMERTSEPGQVIFEPFSGSGTTIIAAEMTGRACHAIELNPAYVDVAVARWQNFTGKSATLEQTGETFAAIAARRCPDTAAAAA